MEKAIKIVVLSVYFGKLPNSFEAWKLSVTYNPKIDFLLITDQEMQTEIKNIKIVKMTFDEIRDLIIRKTSIENIVLERPYKLCDFKPLYGAIFSDLIKDYDYWGYCDMDMVFGDIYSFVVDNEIQKYDKFLRLGHLSLIKNTEEVNSLYKKGFDDKTDYLKILTNDVNVAFDEIAFNKIVMKNGYKSFNNRLFADISIIYNRFRLATAIYKDSKNYKYQLFYWKDGKTYRVYYKNGKRHIEEFIYIHFKQRKKMMFINSVNGYKEFAITPSGFLPLDNIGELDKKKIKKLSQYKGLLSETIEKIRFFIKNT